MIESRPGHGASLGRFSLGRVLLPGQDKTRTARLVLRATQPLPGLVTGTACLRIVGAAPSIVALTPQTARLLIRGYAPSIGGGAVQTAKLRLRGYAPVDRLTKTAALRITATAPAILALSNGSLPPVPPGDWQSSLVYPPRIAYTRVAGTDSQMQVEMLARLLQLVGWIVLRKTQASVTITAFLIPIRSSPDDWIHAGGGGGGGGGSGWAIVNGGLGVPWQITVEGLPFSWYDPALETGDFCTAPNGARGICAAMGFTAQESLQNLADAITAATNWIGTVVVDGGTLQLVLTHKDLGDYPTKANRAIITINLWGANSGGYAFDSAGPLQGGGYWLWSSPGTTGERQYAIWARELWGWDDARETFLLHPVVGMAQAMDDPALVDFHDLDTSSEHLYLMIATDFGAWIFHESDAAEHWNRQTGSIVFSGLAGSGAVVGLQFFRQQLYWAHTSIVMWPGDPAMLFEARLDGQLGLLAPRHDEAAGVALRCGNRVGDPDLGPALYSFPLMMIARPADALPSRIAGPFWGAAHGAERVAPGAHAQADGADFIAVASQTYSAGSDRPRGTLWVATGDDGSSAEDDIGMDLAEVSAREVLTDPPYTDIPRPGCF